MKILIDTNVLLDFYTRREPFFDDADRIMTLCAEKTVEGCIAAHSITNAFYVLRRNFAASERRATLRDLCTIVTVVGIDRDKLIRALENETFPDFEDCLQTECAAAFGADFVVTRNVADFTESRIPAVLPADFLAKLPAGV